MTHEAGVAAPSIYPHFASKGTLPQAVVEEHFVALRRAIELSRQTGDNAASRFLAGRLAYCLYAVDGRGGLHRAEIDHPPWPLQPAEAAIQRNTMTAALGFELPDVAPLVHFAARVDVHVWLAESVRPSGGC